MRDYRKLDVWQLGRQLAVSCYSVTESFPHREQFGLVSQIRRAVVSIPSNIAEGAGRESEAEFLRFVRIALGSLNELETLLLISQDLNLIAVEDGTEFLAKTRDLGVRLRNLAKKIQNDQQN